MELQLTQSILTTPASFRQVNAYLAVLALVIGGQLTISCLKERVLTQVCPTLAPEKIGLVSSVASGPNIGLLGLGAILLRQVKSQLLVPDFNLTVRIHYWSAVRGSLKIK